MARKRRKTSAGKRKKKSKSKPRSKPRSKPARSRRVKKRAAGAAKKRKVRRQQPKTLSDKVASAYHTVVDTIKGTDELRNKMEPPATSETE